MPRSSAIHDWSCLERFVSGISSNPGALEVLFLYGDGPSRSWAQEAGQKLARCAGHGDLCASWWNLNDFCHPGVLAGAVSKAMRADVVLIAVSGSEGVPLPFYYWINSWLPHRRLGRSGLVALLATPHRLNKWSGRLRKYLRAVARNARMEFLVANL